MSEHSFAKKSSVFKSEQQSKKSSIKEKKRSEDQVRAPSNQSQDLKIEANVSNGNFESEDGQEFTGINEFDI